MAVAMISRHRRVWAPTSSWQVSSGHTGAVPDTTTRSPTRTARENPILRSNGDPELIRTRSAMRPKSYVRHNAVKNDFGRGALSGRLRASTGQG